MTRQRQSASASACYKSVKSSNPIQSGVRDIFVRGGESFASAIMNHWFGELVVEFRRTIIRQGASHMLADVNPKLAKYVARIFA
jgi:hypothetical protein